MRTRPTRPAIVEDRTEATPFTRATSRTRGPARVTVAEDSETTQRVRQRTRPTQQVRNQVTNRVRGRPTTEAPIYLPPDTTEFSCDDPVNRNDPRCRVVETTTRFSCDNPENFNNPRCAKPTTTPARRRTTPQATTRFSCDNPENVNNPRCARTQRPTTPVAPTQTVRQRTRPPNTRPPSSDPVTVSRGRGRFTTQAPTYLPPEPVTEFSCANPQNRNDPRCQTTPVPVTTRVPVTTTTQRRIETTTRFTCTPGSTDPRYGI